MSRLYQLAVVGLLLIFFAIACKHDTPELPPVAVTPPVVGCNYSGEICFEASVLPIFRTYCAKAGCHNAVSAEGGYVLDSYANIMKKGIKPGNAVGSKIYEVLFKTGNDRMPEPPNPPLSQPQKDSIAKWINSGAKNTIACNCSCDTTQFTYAATIKPLLDANCTGCHNATTMNGNVNLSNHAGTKTVADNGKLLGSVFQVAGFKPMPEGGKLSDCQLKQLEKWVKAGAPDN